MADIAIQRFLLRRLLALPPAVLRLLSGGGVVYRGGRTLDPRFQYLWKAWRRPVALETLPPQDAREGWAALVAAVAPEPHPEVKTETVLVDGPGGSISTRLYIPQDQATDAPLLVWLHDGGGVVGGLDQSDGLASQLAFGARTVVAVPAYRLAPEHRFPAALDDALAAVRWGREAGDRYGCAPGDVAVGGLSNGAGLAAAVCLELKRMQEPQPARQILICPVLDAGAEGGSMVAFADAWPLSSGALRWTWRQSLGADIDPADPRLSPLRAGDHADLAPAVVVTAGFDPVADQGEAYARKLAAAGVETRYRAFDALPHGFPQFAGVVKPAEQAVNAIFGLMR